MSAAIRHLVERVYVQWFHHNRFLVLSLFVGLVLNCGIWTLFLLKLGVLYQPERQFITLHYKVFYGVDFLGEWYYVLLMPLFALCVLFGNFFFARKIQSANSVLATMIMVAALAIQPIVAGALYLLIQINLF